MSAAFAIRDTVVTGIGAVHDAGDPAPFLRLRKLRKFMGRQDDLAVVAAGRALASASLAAPLGERCGLFLTVGYIPFEADDIARLLDASLEGEEAARGTLTFVLRSIDSPRVHEQRRYVYGLWTRGFSPPLVFP